MRRYLHPVVLILWCVAFTGCQRHESSPAAATTPATSEPASEAPRALDAADGTVAACGDTEFLRLEDGIQPPVVKRRTEPVFPSINPPRQPPDQEVVVDVSILPSGQVCSVAVVQGAAPDADASVVSAVSQWVFEPAQFNGEAVGAVIQLTVHLRSGA